MPVGWVEIIDVGSVLDIAGAGENVVVATTKAVSVSEVAG